jgi:hypothetical protein
VAKRWTKIPAPGRAGSRQRNTTAGRRGLGTGIPQAGKASRNSVCANRACRVDITPGMAVVRTESGSWQHADCSRVTFPRRPWPKFPG